jgi:hypothetical protein
VSIDVSGSRAARATVPAPTAFAGRMCPHDYRYSPAVFDRAADFTADVLYVAGGLYGNLAALVAIEQLVTAERGPATIVFNGDFHWLDAEPEWFATVDRRVAIHTATRGNVETEIGRTSDIGAGCGCAYPEGVDADTVRRSNAIFVTLRGACPHVIADRLAHLPMHLVAAVGGLRVGIVHGDATALAGWSFGIDALDDPVSRPALTSIRQTSRIDVFASTHTCLAALRDFALPSGRLTVINNGAAGMPNFSGMPSGLVTRIGTSRSPNTPLYGLVRDGVHIDALAVPYAPADFLEHFLACWPAGSPAHASYYRRIVGGPEHSAARARPLPG